MKRTISIVTALLFGILGFFQTTDIEDVYNKGDIMGLSNTISIVNRAIPDFSVDEKGDFTVLQVTDTHLMNGLAINDTRTLLSIEEEIDTYAPDLVVASGDMVEGNNKSDSYHKLSALRSLAMVFEKKQQYWAYVPGNNDGEMLGTAADVAAMLSQYDYCIVANEEGLSGATQYSIDLKNAANKTVHSLVFLDSLGRDEQRSLICFQDDQVAWLAEILAAKKALNPGIKVSVFFHVNTPAFKEAGELGVPYRIGYKPIPLGSLENADGNAPADSVMQNSACVSLVSIGHLHPSSNRCNYYNGTYYHVTRASGYDPSKKPGCTLITIHTAAGSTRCMYNFREITFKYTFWHVLFSGVVSRIIN